MKKIMILNGVNLNLLGTKGAAGIRHHHLKGY